MKQQETSDCEESVGMKAVFAAMSRHEKQAWLLLVASCLAVVQMGWRLFSTAGALEKGGGGFYYWYVFWIGYFLFLRKDKTLPVDERDRVIQGRGVRVGYLALALMLVVIATMVDVGGFRDFVASCTGYWLSEFLVWLIFVSVGLHAAVMVWHYWRDRR